LMQDIGSIHRQEYSINSKAFDFKDNQFHE